MQHSITNTCYWLHGSAYGKTRWSLYCMDCRHFRNGKKPSLLYSLAAILQTSPAHTSAYLLWENSVDKHYDDSTQITTMLWNDNRTEQDLERHSSSLLVAMKGGQYETFLKSCCHCSQTQANFWKDLVNHGICWELKAFGTNTRPAGPVSVWVT